MSMVRLGSVVASAVLLLQAPARAQSIKADDLVGMWARVEVLDSDGKPKTLPPDTLVFESDSVYYWTSMPKAMRERIRLSLRWKALRGDSLYFVFDTIPNWTLALKDQQLSIAILAHRRVLQTDIFKRVDAPKSKP